MTGVGNHCRGHIIVGEAHDKRLHRPERLLAAHGEHRNGQAAVGEKRAVVNGILIERGKLREARMHRTGFRIELRVVSARPRQVAGRRD